MRILLVGMGGVNAAFKNWTEPSLARALVGRGHTVYSYSYLDPRVPHLRQRDENVAGVQVHRVSLGPLGFSFDLWRTMRHDPLPDVVHIHHLRNLLSWQTTLFFQRRGVPVILSPIGLLHDRFISDNRDNPYAYPLKYDNLIFNASDLRAHLLREFSPRKHLNNWLTHFPLRCADHLIALSQSEKELFIRLGIPAERITVIPFAVDLTMIDRALTDRTTASAPQYPHPLVLFIGQLKYRKGFDLLLRAAPRVRAVFPTASFVFLTHNLSQQEAFMHLVDEVGARDYVFLVKQGGDDTEGQKLRQLAACDVFVFPTRYEGFGIPLIEAMACRAPIVTTNIPVVDEIVQEGETGLLAALNDPEALARKIIQLLQDEALRQRLIANGRAQLEACYTEVQLGARTEQVYQQVLECR